jgi:hypothetical protein
MNMQRTILEELLKARLLYCSLTAAVEHHTKKIRLSAANVPESMQTTRWVTLNISFSCMRPLSSYKQFVVDLTLVPLIILRTS